ncbi:MAG: Hsp20/alpha crystallin family protein [Chitinophagales bacterium]|nr:Hsp20/alpha crystallin family protein [Chitinophagales bacterium]MDW8273912.1 Hsp20/alpha crystallin family protein [Chitinophagales bacterium]
MSNITRKLENSLLGPFFRDFFDADSFFNLSTGTMPAANIAETDKEYSIELAVPGFKKEEFKIKVDKDVLTISAESESETKEEKKEYTRREYNYSSFSRSFRLPDNVKDDAIKARYENGILKLSLPKTEQQITATKEIKVE